MTLDELYFEEFLSTNTYNVCRAMGFNSVDDIQKYYKENKTFKKIRNCGTKSSDQLLYLCSADRFKKQDLLPPDVESSTGHEVSQYEMKTIKDLWLNKQISKRTYNICLFNNLLNAEDIFNYYLENSNFTDLRNCGKLSNQELINLCNDESEFFRNKKNPEISIEQRVEDLNSQQISILDIILHLEFEKLITRTQNAINKYIGENLTVKNFAKKFIFLDHEDDYKTEISGQKILKQILNLKSKIYKSIIEITDINDDEHLRKLQNYYIQKLYINDEDLRIEEGKQYGLFKVVQEVLQSEGFYSVPEFHILNKCLKVFTITDKNNLSDIAIKLKFTRERVRQIRNEIIKDFPSKFNFVSQLSDKYLDGVKGSNEINYIFFNDDFTKQINSENGTNFTPEFITFLTSIFLKPEFALIGDFDQLICYKDLRSRVKYNWKNFYLLRTDLAEKFEILDFIKDIDSKTQQPFQQDQTYNFSEIVKKYLENQSIEMLPKILPFATLLLKNEFSLELNQFGNLVFQRTKRKGLPEYIYDALLQLRKPQKAEQLLAYLNENFPGVAKNVEQIRTSALRNEQIVPIGRSSTYGLKIWEKVNENFKGGTILRIVEEFLNKFQVPKHISEIEKYVIQFRPETNWKNIFNNLRVDPKRNFLFFRGGLVGLRNHIYDSQYVLLDDDENAKPKPWAERLQDLKDFCLRNNHLPLSNSNDTVESSLYTWMKLQNSFFRKGKLSEDKMSMIKEITSRFPTVRKSRAIFNGSIEKYDLLKTFINNKGRLPDYKIDGEMPLYRFVNLQRRLMLADKLSFDEKKAYNEVIKKFENGSQLSLWDYNE